MTATSTKVVLFSEINSKFGDPYLRRLDTHPAISVEALVTSPDGTVCDYYVGEANPVNLETECRERGIPIFKPDDVNSDALYDELSSLSPDFSFIANYQQIFEERLLGLPAETTINFHPSPLPRYAGRAPFFWMAKNGETDGGVSAIETVPEIDSGPIVKQRPVALDGTESAREIRDRHFEESERLLDDVIELVIRRELDSVPQDLTKRTYYGTVSESDYHIDWTNDTETILGTIRASCPRPGAVTVNEDGETIRILRASSLPPSSPELNPSKPGSPRQDTTGVLVATGDGWIRIESVRVGNKEIELQSTRQCPQLRSTLAARPNRTAGNPSQTES